MLLEWAEAEAGKVAAEAATVIAESVSTKGGHSPDSSGQRFSASAQAAGSPLKEAAPKDQPLDSPTSREEAEPSATVRTADAAPPENLQDMLTSLSASLGNSPLARRSPSPSPLSTPLGQVSETGAVREQATAEVLPSPQHVHDPVAAPLVAPDPTPPENAELAVVEQDLSSALVAKDFKLAKKLKVRRDELRKIVSAEVHVPSTSLLPTASSTVEVKATGDLI